MKTKRKQNNKFMRLLAVSLVLVLSLSLGLGCASPDACYACEDCVSDMALNEGEGVAVAVIPCDENCPCDGTNCTLYGCEDCSCGDGIATISEYVGIDESDEYTLDTGTLQSFAYDIGFAKYTYSESEIGADNADVMTASYSPSVTGDADVTISASVQYPEDADGYIGYMQIYYLGPNDSTFTEYLDEDDIIVVASEIDYETTYTGSYTFENLEAGMHKVVLKFYSSNDDVNAVYTTASTIIVSGSITEMSTISDVSMTSGTDTTVSFTHSTNGELGDLTYLWYLNNSAYEVTEDPEIILNDLEAGIYTMFCKVVPEVGIATNTNSFTVNVSTNVAEGGITIVSQPSNVQVKEGEAAVVSISLTAEEGELGYAWYIGSTAITGNNSPTLSINGLTEGTYSVYCVVSVDGEYSFTSSTATITVVSEDADADTDTDADVTVDDEEEETFFTKAGNWYNENTTLFWALIVLAGVGIIYVVKKK